MSNCTAVNLWIVQGGGYYEEFKDYDEAMQAFESESEKQNHIMGDLVELIQFTDNDDYYIRIKDNANQS